MDQRVSDLQKNLVDICLALEGAKRLKLHPWLRLFISEALLGGLPKQTWFGPLISDQLMQEKTPRRP